MATTTAASTIFKCLSGTWTLHRTLTSAIPSFPSGTFTGSATFTPISSSSSSSSSDRKETLLYTETGELITTNGLTLRANKKYIYTYSPTDDKLSAWFVKESRGNDENRKKDNSETGNNAIGGNNVKDVEIDYLFHELVFGDQGGGEGVSADGKWKAIGDHLCIKDNYSARYEFEIGNGELRRWMLRYDVKGPAKDYVSETRFER
ncbi:hypothetical protein TWF788_001872 [Orbilia oligospora]|uniref:DUF6314 domain-containing protein n=1 Tax=Orbilia oligospora TaxID=2813651 RepID=A0A6G1M1R4_ORBOL|nr:hypothetical protein TWF788_001872 [Orbilia oligospora]KAF3210195.1 hypothetical protein TWF679_006943 [Orbilia oligospora]KAF3230247.1 hypothetical protein TWF191_010944 [Orbilia oligospora]KAF3241971.1 hypothetical protein TWF192_008745 [Orbilia oligospora]